MGKCDQEATKPIDAATFAGKEQHPAATQMFLHGQLRPPSIERAAVRYFYSHAQKCTFSMSSNTLSASASEKFP